MPAQAYGIAVINVDDGTALPYMIAMHSVVETPDYLVDARATGIDDAERIAIVDAIAADPEAGDEIKGTGGARKIRFAGRGKGKSGGYRIITFYSGQDVPVFLLNVFSKGERVDLTQAERNALKAELPMLVEEYRRYRKGTRRNVKRR